MSEFIDHKSSYNLSCLQYTPRRRHKVVRLATIPIYIHTSIPIIMYVHHIVLMLAIFVVYVTISYRIKPNSKYQV